MSAKQQMPNSNGPISEPYDVSEIPASGVEGLIELDSEQLDAVSRLLDVPEVKYFHFSYRLTPLRQKRFKLTGNLKAHVIQECVITLEPIETVVEEEIDINLWPLKDVEVAEKLAEEEGRTVLLDGPEPITGNAIDIGQLAYEHFANALDPFPRIKGAEFKWTGIIDDEMHDQPNKPFTGLDELLRKKGQQSGGS